jgi:hypothetical protein
MFLHNSRYTTSTTMISASVRRRDGAEDLHKQQWESIRVGPKPKFKDWDSYGLCPWDEPLEGHTVQIPTKSAYLHYSLATCTNPESQMWHLVSLYMNQKECACRYCSYFTYVTYLSQVPPAPVSCTAVLELMQYLQIFSTKKWWFIQNAVKLFHTFVELWPHSCS